MNILVAALALFALLVGGTALVMTQTPQSASLAGDVGLSSDAYVCNALRDAGPLAVSRLESTGFPHATTSPAETYRLVERTSAGGDVVQAQISIDWAAASIECLPDTYLGPVDATFVLHPAAYGALVGEIQNVVLQGETSGHTVGNAWAIWRGTQVDIHGNDAYANAYKAELAKWAAGMLAREVV